MRMIEGALGAVPGVVSASVSLINERATVEFDASLVDVGRLREVIREAEWFETITRMTVRSTRLFDSLKCLHNLYF